MRDKLKQFYIRQSFRPGLIGLVINPFYIARKGLFLAISELAPLVKGRVLDVGCGHKPYRDLFQCSEYIGLEVERAEKRSADVFYDGHVIPYADASFDNVITNQVLEHVFEPDEFLSEIHRVLKPGGGILVTVPFVWDEHEQPFDYAFICERSSPTNLPLSCFRLCH